jgi:phosphoribosylformylglycinamidine cyclo-ligase
MPNPRLPTRRLTYAGTGVSRARRENSRATLAQSLRIQSSSYGFGKAVRLPFGLVFPSPTNSDVFLDLQIEGIGTKTLLAEIANKYDQIGIDAVAMVVNDVLRSGAKPLLLSDAIHISRSRQSVIAKLVRGVIQGAKISGCSLASGETGDVHEILHSPISDASLPFDMTMSCLGLVEKEAIISGKISPGDEIIGLESSGIHSNGLTLARKLLLRKWGGVYDYWETPHPLRRPLIEELLEPTRIYSSEMRNLEDQLTINAAVHITGDGFGKFRRLLEWTRRRGFGNLGLSFQDLGEVPSVFRLIFETARRKRSPVSAKEMFETFNMGYGFAVLVDKKNLDAALDSLNNQGRAKRIGRVTQSGLISIESSLSDRPLILST